MNLAHFITPLTLQRLTLPEEQPSIPSPRQMPTHPHKYFQNTEEFQRPLLDDNKSLNNSCANKVGIEEKKGQCRQQVVRNSCDFWDNKVQFRASERHQLKPSPTPLKHPLISLLSPAGEEHHRYQSPQFILNMEQDSEVIEMQQAIMTGQEHEVIIIEQHSLLMNSARNQPSSDLKQSFARNTHQNNSQQLLPFSTIAKKQLQELSERIASFRAINSAFHLNMETRKLKADQKQLNSVEDKAKGNPIKPNWGSTLIDQTDLSEQALRSLGKCYRRNSNKREAFLDKPQLRI